VETVQLNKSVTIRYTMHSHLPDGSGKRRDPETLTFIFGVERQVPTLEAALENASTGQVFHLDVPPSEIYGEHDPALVREIPKKGLIKQRLREGRFYRQMKTGSLISFKVLEIRENTVVADFNKPLAGIRVSMDVEVLDIRDATPEEIRKAMEVQARKDIGCG